MGRRCPPPPPSWLLRPRPPQSRDPLDSHPDGPGLGHPQAPRWAGGCLCQSGPSAGLQPLAPVKVPQRRRWGQGQPARPRSELAGQACSPRVPPGDLGPHCGTTAASQGPGNPAAASETPEAAAAGLALAREAPRGLPLERRGQPLGRAAAAQARQGWVLVEAGVCGQGRAQPGEGRMDTKQALGGPLTARQGPKLRAGDAPTCESWEAGCPWPLGRPILPLSCRLVLSLFP